MSQCLVNPFNKILLHTYPPYCPPEVVQHHHIHIPSSSYPISKEYLNVISIGKQARERERERKERRGWRRRRRMNCQEKEKKKKKTRGTSEILTPGPHLVTRPTFKLIPVSIVPSLHDPHQFPHLKHSREAKEREKEMSLGSTYSIFQKSLGDPLHEFRSCLTLSFDKV